MRPECPPCPSFSTQHLSIQNYFDHPAKSPALTSTHVTADDQLVQSVELKDEPLESPTHHCPEDCTRPTMSVLPSPLKSPTCTSTQVTVGDHVSQTEEVNDSPQAPVRFKWEGEAGEASAEPGVCVERTFGSAGASPSRMVGPRTVSGSVTLGGLCR